MVDERHDSDEQLADVAEPGEVQLSPGLIDKINDLKEELAETEARFQKAEARSNTLLETQIASSPRAGWTPASLAPEPPQTLCGTESSP